MLQSAEIPQKAAVYPEGAPRPVYPTTALFPTQHQQHLQQQQIQHLHQQKFAHQQHLQQQHLLYKNYQHDPRYAQAPFRPQFHGIPPQHRQNGPYAPQQHAPAHYFKSKYIAHPKSASYRNEGPATSLAPEVIPQLYKNPVRSKFCYTNPKRYTEQRRVVHSKQYSTKGVVTAVYAGVPVFEQTVNNVQVMRRRKDSWFNATHILKCSGLDKSHRTRVLDRCDYKHEKIQGGYGKFQGTWIALENAMELAKVHGIYEHLQDLFNLDYSKIEEKK